MLKSASTRHRGVRARVPFSILPRGKGGGGKMTLYNLLGEQRCIHVQSMQQTREVWGHSPLGKFDFGPFIEHNLVQSGIVFAQT